MGIYRAEGITSALTGNTYRPPATSDYAGFTQALPTAQTASTTPGSSGIQPSLAQLQQNYDNAVATARANGQLPNGPYAPGFLGSPDGPKVPQEVTDAWNSLHRGQGPAAPGSPGSQPSLAQLQQNYNNALAAARASGQLPYGPYVPGREPGSPDGPKVPQAVTDAWNSLHPGQGPATPAPPPLTGLPGPLDPALATLWTNAAGDTDPARTKQNQVIEAVTAAQLWSGEATRRLGLATQAQQDTAAAKAQYGENSPQYLAALARENAAWASVWQANANANQAAAQLGVYAADPSYAPAMNGAKTVIDAGLKPLGKQWNIPQAKGSLSDAKAQLTKAGQIVQLANQAVQKFQNAATEFSQLPNKYDPLLPYKDLGQNLTVQNDPGPSWQTLNDEHRRAYYHNQALYSGGLKDMADGNKLSADVSVEVLKQQLALLKPGTKEYNETQSALADAKKGQATAGTNQGVIQTYYNLAASNDRLAQLDQQFDNIKDRALAAARQTNSYWFDPKGYFNANNKYSGKLTGIDPVIGKDGQLHAIFTYENWSIDIQLTFAPDHQPNRLPDSWKAVSAEWASFNAPARSAGANASLPSNNIMGLANYQQVSAAQAAIALQAANAQKQIADLTAKYQDAVTAANTGRTGANKITYQTDSAGPGAPAGPNIPAAVTAAWNDLQKGRQNYAQLYPQLQAYGEWLSFLSLQDLSNYGNQDRQNELQAAFTKSSTAEQQRVLTPLAQQYNAPILLGQQSQKQVSDTVSAALKGQTQDDTAVTDKIQQLGGNGGTLQVVSGFFLPDSGGMIPLTLFSVTDAQGHTRWVDSSGRDYDSTGDYGHNAQMPEGGTFYFPALKAKPAYQLVANVTGQASTPPSSFVFDAQGNAAVQTLKIDGPSKTMQFVDGAVGIITSVATITAFAFPAVGLIAIAGGIYLSIRAGQDLADMHAHGQSWASWEGVMDFGMIVASLLPEGAGAFRTAGLMRSAKVELGLGQALRSGFRLVNAGKMTAEGVAAAPWAVTANAVMESGGWWGKGWFKAAKILDRTGMAIGIGLMSRSGYEGFKYWNEMSDLDKLNNGLSFVVGLFATGMGVRGYHRGGRGGSVQVEDPVTGNVITAKVHPRLMPALSSLLDGAGVLNAEHVYASLRLDESGNVTHQRTQADGRYILYRLENGDNVLLPRIAANQVPYLRCNSWQAPNTGRITVAMYIPQRV
jgi:hypothetical protein